MYGFPIRTIFHSKVVYSAYKWKYMACVKLYNGVNITQKRQTGLNLEK